MKLLSVITTLSFFCLLSGLAQAQVILEDNFDSQADWTVQQNSAPDVGCFTSYNGPCPTSPPSNWAGYYNGMSYLAQVNPAYGVGYNNIYINSIAGYPYESSQTCRGGMGKCITYWDEMASQNFVNSDGDLFLDLGNEYSGIYVRFFIKYGRKADGSGS